MSVPPVSDLEVADKILDLIEKRLELVPLEIDVVAPDDRTEDEIFEDLCNHLGLEKDYEREGVHGTVARQCAAWFYGQWHEMVREVSAAIDADEASLLEGAETGINHRETRLAVEAIIHEIREADRGAA